MKLIKFKSIKSQLLTWIIISTLIVFGSLIGFTIMKSQARIRSSMDAKINTISALLQKISASFYENFDYGPLGEFAKEAGKDSEIEFVVFLDDNKEPLAKAGDDTVEIAQEFIFEKEIHGKDG
ncbi:MAG: hypothetical protein GY749_02965 [Desulfobacteraceae bacterium]|nr:hypothetical protein [Desulfobacteraceae bacterium]